MATIQPAVDYPIVGCTRILWETLTSDDTAAPWMIRGSSGVAGNIQVVGDFGSDASVSLEASNDGTNWAAIDDIEGDVIGVTANNVRDFSTAALYIRPAVADGTAEDLDIYVALRQS